MGGLHVVTQHRENPTDGRGDGTMHQIYPNLTCQTIISTVQNGPWIATQIFLLMRRKSDGVEKFTVPGLCWHLGCVVHDTSLEILSAIMTSNFFFFHLNPTNLLWPTYGVDTWITVPITSRVI